jgi:cyclase
VKTRRFADHKYVGDPINAVKIFNEKEVDEIVILDIQASKNNKEPNYSLLEQIASECFMPVCYGGGVTKVDQAVKLVQLGIEKIAINVGAIENLNLVREIADVLGSSSVVAGIDVKVDWLGRPRVFNAASGRLTKSVPWEYGKKLEQSGAGEIFLNNVDQDGMQKGYDLDLISKVARSVSIPVIVCGGAGRTEDFAPAVLAGASAVAAGSLFVFHGRHRAVLISYPLYKDLEALLGNI